MTTRAFMGAIAVACSLAGLGFAQPAWAASATEFEVFSYDLKSDGGTAEMPGRLYVPPSIPAGEKRPLVIFLHGSAERGDNNASQVNSNINGLFEAAKARGFFLYAPQLPAGGTSWDAARIDTAMGMVAKATQDYAVDTSRIAVTGISLGGGGARVAISTYTDVLSAALPLSGITSGEVTPATLVGKPIWQFHGDEDETDPVPVRISDQFANAIRSAAGKPAWTFPDPANTGAPYYPYYYPTLDQTVNADYYEDNNLRYSRYTSGGHATKEWTKYYRESWVTDWMLAQQVAPRPIQQGERALFDLGTTTLSGGKDPQDRRWNASVADEEKTLATAIPFARLSSGERTQAGLTVTDAFSGSASRGRTSGSAYASAVAIDTWTVSATDAATLQLDGLKPGGAYSVSLFGSDTDSDGGLGRMTRYTIGAEFRDLQIYNNLSDVALFERILADAMGRITLTVSVAPGSGARFGGLGAIELTAVPEPAAGAAAGGLLLALLGRRHRVTQP